jgi:hypothetical protein
MVMPDALGSRNQRRPAQPHFAGEMDKPVANGLAVVER